MRRIAGGERGQGTLEYAGLLALVLVVLLAAGVGAGVLPGAAAAVARQMQRAVCLVGGGDCLATERRPCAVRSAAVSGGATVKLAVLRIGRRAVLVRSRLSDGSEELTVADAAEIGGEVGVGIDGAITVGGVSLVDAGAGVSAAALAQLGSARTWRVRDRRAADALQRRLVERLAGQAAGSVVPGLGFVQRVLGVGAGRRLPEPDATGERLEGSVSAGADARAGTIGGAVQGGEAAVRGAGAVARRRDRATGRTTYVLEVSGAAGAALAGAIDAAAGAAPRGTAIALTYDRRGRMLDLTVTASHAGAAGADGPPEGGRSAGTIEIARSLDLGGGGAAAGAVGALLAALRPDRAAALPVAARAVAALLAREGRTEARRYATAHDTWLDARAEAALVAKAGVSLSLVHDARRLVDAWSRPAGGLWERRGDCL